MTNPETPDGAAGTSSGGFAMARDEYGALVWPAEPRTKYPRQWIKVFGWRQAVVFTPKIARRSAVLTFRLIPRYGGALIGLWVGRDDDDDGEWNLRLGVGLAEVEMLVMRWLPRDPHTAEGGV